MLLNNNGPPTADAVHQQQQQQQSNNVVFRRPKNETSNQQQQRNNNKSSSSSSSGGGSKKDNRNRGAGGSQAVRNSWSFTNEQQQQQLPIQQQPVIKESIYADPDALYNGNIGEQLKSVSRSRLRQRSVSNLTAASLAGTRSRDHSSSNRHHQGGGGGSGGGQNGAGGTVSAKGVDYIRIHHMTTSQQQQQSGHVVRPSVLALQHPVITNTTATSDVVISAVAAGTTTSAIINALLSPVVQQQQQMQDRSEYGNPDGSSAHSTAEREAGGLTTSKSADPILPADIYTAINQNTSNDFKIMNQQQQQQQNYLMSYQEEQQQQQQMMTTSALIRLGSGRGSSSSSSTKTNTPTPPTSASTPTQRFPPSCASTGKSSSSAATAAAEVHSRKSTSASAGGASVVAGPNAVKTEWTFLPSPTAAVEPQQQQHLVVHREINSKPEESSMVRKGLLWVMRDRIFSRYHERFCILTRNYLHCFKKGSEVSLTQMGNFLFKVSLAEVTAVQWLDKKGTAIVCLTLAKEGRLLVKTSMDLNGWYDDFQTGVKETIGRRQTLLHDQRRGGETFNGSTVVVPSRHIIAAGQQQQPHQVPLRDRSLAARNRSANRFSLMSDHDIKSTAAGMNNHGPASEITNKNADPASSGLSVEPHSLCYSVPPQIVPSSSSSKSSSASTPVPTPTTASGPPVPVPYRERSVSFDRSRASKAEREAKRRSYYPSSHVTQV